MADVHRWRRVRDAGGGASPLPRGTVLRSVCHSHGIPTVVHDSCHVGDDRPGRRAALPGLCAASHGVIGSGLVAACRWTLARESRNRPAKVVLDW